MNLELKGILESLLMNMDVLGSEMLRMERSEQFSHSRQCFELIERIRDSCTDNLKALHAIERRLHAIKLLPPRDEQFSAEILLLLKEH